jgi:Integrase core domain
MSTTKTDELLNKLFNDPNTGFVGADKLLRRAKETNKRIAMKQVKDFLNKNAIHQVFQKPKQPKTEPKIHGKIGHYHADFTFLTRYQKYNSNYHILLNVINVNTKFAYSVALKDKIMVAVLNALESIRQKAINEGRPLRVLQTDNGIEFQNHQITKWLQEKGIAAQYCDKEDKKCLGVAERFNRTIKLLIEKYITNLDTNRWIDNLDDFVQNYNSSYHSMIKKIPEQLEIFDEAELIRKSIAHNNQVESDSIKRCDFVRLLNKRGAFEKEGQSFTGRIYLVEEVGLHSVMVQGKKDKFNMSDVLKVPPLTKEIDNSLRLKQLDLYKADKRIREREGIEPDRRESKKRKR